MVVVPKLYINNVKLLVKFVKGYFHQIELSTQEGSNHTKFDQIFKNVHNAQAVCF